MNPIPYFPEEIDLHIQNHLDRNGAANYCQVSHTWNNSLNKNDQAWKAIFPEITFPEKVKSKQYLNEHAVTSEDAILECVEKFASKLLLNQKGTFTCLFPFNKNCTLTADMKFSGHVSQATLFNFTSGSTRIEPEKQEPIDETCIFIKKLGNNNEEPTIKNSFEEIKYAVIPKFWLAVNGSSYTEFKANIVILKSKEPFIPIFHNHINKILNNEMTVKYSEFFDRREKYQMMGYGAVTCIVIVAIRYSYLQ